MTDYYFLVESCILSNWECGVGACFYCIDAQKINGKRYIMGVVLTINLGNYGSTGKVINGISKIAEDKGWNVIKAYPETSFNVKSDKKDIIICSNFWKKVNDKLGYLTGYIGCFSIISTWRFLRKIDDIKPDIIHLHNIHNCYINHGMLFNYIKKHDIRVIWTLHDCWAFTGQCPHYMMENCNKWKSGCFDCNQIQFYPATKWDKTNIMWAKKKKWFTGVNRMTITTPSLWLANQIKESYLSKYPVKVINNGIDLEIFKPRESSFRKDYACEDNIIVLGVSFGWSNKKGLSDFIYLANELDDRYKVVLVGADDSVDNHLPSNIITIHKTSNQIELAEIYSAADVFVNPTLEDNFPTVNMEALACGTPVITYATGGSPEIVDETCGIVVERSNQEELKASIYSVTNENRFLKEDCVKHAREYDAERKLKEYVEMYLE